MQVTTKQQAVQCTDLTVVLCSYNGERYIREQIKSILCQTLLPASIIIVDDSSNDSTVSIITEYLESKPVRIFLFRNEFNLGVCKSFGRAINLVSTKYTALCDQDDVWAQKKLEFAMNKMLELESMYGEDTPLLVHSDLTVVDSSLKVLSNSFFDYRGIQHEHLFPLDILLVQNYVTGCTVLFNDPLKRIALPLPSSIIMHDWWLAQLAAAVGKVGFVDSPTVFYRQHGLNVVGASRLISLKNLVRFFKVNSKDPSLARLVLQGRELYKRLTSKNFMELAADVDYKINALAQGGALNYFRLVRLGVRKQGVARNLFLFFQMCFHKNNTIN